jgi:hypothetical protein
MPQGDDVEESGAAAVRGFCFRVEGGSEFVCILRGGRVVGCYGAEVNTAGVC